MDAGGAENDEIAQLGLNTNDDTDTEGLEVHYVPVDENGMHINLEQWIMLDEGRLSHIVLIESRPFRGLTRD